MNPFVLDRSGPFSNGFARYNVVLVSRRFFPAGGQVAGGASPSDRWQVWFADLFVGRRFGFGIKFNHATPSSHADGIRFVVALRGRRKK